MMRADSVFAMGSMPGAIPWPRACMMLLVGGTVVLVLMIVLWLFAMRRNNMAVVDVGWSFGLVIMAMTHALLGPGLLLRRLMMAGMVVFWGLRLGIHLWRRVAGESEDGRYRQLKRQWGASGSLAGKFLLFFLFQGVLDIFLSLPVLLAAFNRSPRISLLEWAGVLLWAVSVGGEALADWQLAAFKRQYAGRRVVCEIGLWKYSRHPNYFFEWLVWVAWALYALASPYGWLAFLCPALMLHFLLRVTGIPATEEQALRTKGELYRKYQQTTSSFIPWFKRTA